MVTRSGFGILSLFFKIGCGCCFRQQLILIINCLNQNLQNFFNSQNLILKIILIRKILIQTIKKFPRSAWEQGKGWRELLALKRSASKNLDKFGYSSS